MFFCWITAYTILPALLICFHQLGGLKKNPTRLQWQFSYLIAKTVKNTSIPILILTLFLTFFSISMLYKINPTVLETDLKKLRNIDSIHHGSIYWSKFVDEVFQHYLSPLVILPENFKNVIPIQNQLIKLKSQEGAQSFISNIFTINDFVPKNQDEKIKILHEIDESLKPKIRFTLEKKDRYFLDLLLSKNSLHSFSAQDIPELIQRKFRERDHTLGKLILVEPSLSEEVAKSQALIQFVHSIRQATDKIEPGAPVAGSLPVTADMFESILNDGPKTTLFAFIAVLLLIIALLRSPFSIMLCALTLILGVLWLIGIALALGEKINFLNFIALPITFGIGVDYGINIFQRYRLEKGNDIIKVIQNTGGAVILASFTTVIGYGSLIMARNQAFVSFGKLAILGEFCCVTAAVISLPALLYHLNPEKKVHHGILVHKKIGT